jgi:ribosome-dependent ATPase
MNLSRTWAIGRREAMELWRDKLRLAFCFLVPFILMLLFGYGLSLDIENVPFAVLDQDKSPQSRAYIDNFRHSRYFHFLGEVSDPAVAKRLMIQNDIQLYFEIPHRFGQNLLAKRKPQVGIFINGTMPYRANTIKSYVEGMNVLISERFQVEHRGFDSPVVRASIEPRFWYNQGLKSKDAFVPALIAVNLLTFSAILTALAITREKELGTILNYYATPVTPLEFLTGKQLPYILIGVLNACLMFLLAIGLFQVPMKGSVVLFTIGALLYVLTSSAFGVMIGMITRSQIGALLVTFLITMIPSFQYSGLFTPVSSLQGAAQGMAYFYPTMYFVNISVGTFTKGITLADQWQNFLALLVFWLAVSTLLLLFFSKQER